jgi:aspartyl protease family protein
MRTGNGTVRADAATLDTLAIGSTQARNLKVVIAPGLGNVDVLGMNFLSALASWRVEGRTLILVPTDRALSEPPTR